MSKVSFPSGVPRVGTGPCGTLGSCSLLSEWPRDWVRTQWTAPLSTRKKRVLPLTFPVVMGSWGLMILINAPISFMLSDWGYIILLLYMVCTHSSFFQGPFFFLICTVILLKLICSPGILLFSVGPLNEHSHPYSDQSPVLLWVFTVKNLLASSKTCDLFIPLDFSNFYNFLWISVVDWVRKAILIVCCFSGASGSMGVTSSNPPGRNPARDSWSPQIILDTFERWAGFLMTLSFWSKGSGGVFPAPLTLVRNGIPAW